MVKQLTLIFKAFGTPPDEYLKMLKDPAVVDFIQTERCMRHPVPDVDHFVSPSGDMSCEFPNQTSHELRLPLNLSNTLVSRWQLQGGATPAEIQLAKDFIAGYSAISISLQQVMYINNSSITS